MIAALFDAQALLHGAVRHGKGAQNVDTNGLPGALCVTPLDG